MALVTMMIMPTASAYASPAPGAGGGVGLQSPLFEMVGAVLGREGGDEGSDDGKNRPITDVLKPGGCHENPCCGLSEEVDRGGTFQNICIGRLQFEPDAPAICVMHESYFDPEKGVFYEFYILCFGSPGGETWIACIRESGYDGSGYYEDETGFCG